MESGVVISVLRHSGCVSGQYFIPRLLIQCAEIFCDPEAKKKIRGLKSNLKMWLLENSVASSTVERQ